MATTTAPNRPACRPAGRRDLEAGRQRRGRYRLDAVHRLPQVRAACPYGAPQWDPQEMVIKKCNMCIDELEAGRKPYCVMACMMRVLDIGPIEEIWRGTLKTTAIGPHDQPVKQVKNMANPELTERRRFAARSRPRNENQLAGLMQHRMEKIEFFVRHAQRFKLDRQTGFVEQAQNAVFAIHTGQNRDSEVDAARAAVGGGIPRDDVAVLRQTPVGDVQV